MVCCVRNDSVDCVESLVLASSHETNDSDVDGRTPMLLACLNGHHQVVHLLLTLGADITKRCRDHLALFTTSLHCFAGIFLFKAAFVRWVVIWVHSVMTSTHPDTHTHMHTHNRNRVIAVF